MIGERRVEIDFRSARVVYVRMPPHEPGGYTSTSAPLAIGVSFTAHARAVVLDGGEGSSELSIPAGACSVGGLSPITWLRVSEPSEAVEIQGASEELASVSEDLGVAWHDRPDRLQARCDPAVWGVCARFRMAALGTAPLDDVEADGLVRGLLLHVAVHHLHVPPPRRFRARLDQRRLARVTDFIESSLHTPPSLREMADLAAISPFHFQRLFRAATGFTPHAYVMARRMERARRLLGDLGLPVADVAGSLGFSDLSHFRRNFRRQFNTSPGALRRCPND
jgi:AraC family transcriptional regulator